MAHWVDAMAVDAVKPGQCTVFESEIGPIAVVSVDGTIYAIEDRCSHDGGDLASGRCEGDQLVCPRHGARFCVRTGEALSPPAYEAIEVFPARVCKGRIQVDLGD
ncbi:MAG: non-heme iron oxygenase ferredoxin subunit [Alphaproteobacteria bacterium]|nr:MAG: non-heme iron oxygenase ferredoxin subunit [Alphaproteobacteria bacterium]